MQAVGPVNVFEQQMDGGRFGFGDIIMDSVEGRLEWEKLEAENPPHRWPWYSDQGGV